MKTIIAISLLLLGILGCKQDPPAVIPCPPCPSIDTSQFHAARIQYDAQRISDSLVIDSLKTELFLSKFTIEKVKFYVEICLKKPSQDKFLKGWIRRTVGI